MVGRPTCTLSRPLPAGLKKPGFFFKKSPTQWVFGVLLGFGILLGFLDKQGKIGKIIQKLSNLKP